MIVPYAAPRPIRPAAPACGALVLLAVLIAHLAYMASPFHEPPAAASLTSAASGPAVPTGPGQMPALAASPARAGHGDHCGMEWAKLARGSGAALLLADGPPGAWLAIHARSWGIQPAGAAFGAGAGGDAQALLQVFRE